MTGPRDWDKELAEIDKLMQQPTPAASPPVPATGDERRATPARQSAPSADGGRATADGRANAAARARPIAIWAVALLGVLGAAALAVWPYDKACNLPLGIYLVGVLAVFGASVWTMRLGWATRRGAVLIIGMITMVAALALAALEVLPRTGYAKVAATWTCGL